MSKTYLKSDHFNGGGSSCSAAACGANPARSSRALEASMRCLALALGSMRIPLNTLGAATTRSCASSLLVAPERIRRVRSSSTASTNASSLRAVQVESSKRWYFARTCVSVKTPSANLARSSTKPWSFLSSTISGTKPIANLSSQHRNTLPPAYPLANHTCRKTTANLGSLQHAHHLRSLISRQASPNQREAQTTTQRSGSTAAHLAPKKWQTKNHHSGCPPPRATPTPKSRRRNRRHQRPSAPRMAGSDYPQPTR